jgi:hypothetical protein
VFEKLKHAGSHGTNSGFHRMIWSKKFAKIKVHFEGAVRPGGVPLSVISTAWFVQPA